MKKHKSQKEAATYNTKLDAEIAAEELNSRGSKNWRYSTQSMPFGWIIVMNKKMKHFDVRCQGVSIYDIRAFTLKEAKKIAAARFTSGYTVVSLLN